MARKRRKAASLPANRRRSSGQAAPLLGSAWTADETRNNGYPYLKNVKAPANGGGPSGPAQLATPSGLAWDKASVSWTAVPQAAGYTVRLYRQMTGGGALVGTYENVTEPRYDFTQIIVQSGDYYVTVQAMGDGAETADSKVSAQSPVYTFVNRDEEGYILIQTPEELLALAEKDTDLSQNYRLAGDIDMSGVAARPSANTPPAATLSPLPAFSTAMDTASSTFRYQGRRCSPMWGKRAWCAT